MFSGLIEAMRAAGVAPDNATLIADGKLRRFRLPEDKPKAKSAYITLFDNGDGTHGASFGSWKHGIKETWFSGKPHKELTAEEKGQFAQKMAAAKAKQEEEQRRVHANAANKAADLWHKAQTASGLHPYLTRKGVQVHGIKQLGEFLVVPVRNTQGQLTSLQFIDPEGEKKFLSGGQCKGCYHSVGGRPDKVLLLAEGYATASTLYEATGYPCAVCFSAGNLKSVALALNDKYPQVQIVICADADPVGRAAAEDAAAAVNGTWLKPDFSESETFT